MPALDVRLIVLLIWGGGTVLVWGGVLRRSIQSHRIHHDARSRRELIAMSALFLVALASGVAVALALFGTAGTGIRSFATTVALGAFLGAGIVLLSIRDVGEDV